MSRDREIRDRESAEITKGWISALLFVVPILGLVFFHPVPQNEVEAGPVKDNSTVVAYKDDNALNNPTSAHAEISLQQINFNRVVKVTVVSNITGDKIVEITGKLSTFYNKGTKELRVTIEDNGTYTETVIGLGDNLTYIEEDLNLPAEEVENYRYNVNYGDTTQ